MSIQGVRTIGLIGAGHIGSQVARAVLAAGYDVVIANSRGPETLTELVEELGPQARAVTAVEAATTGDLVVVTIPLKAIDTVPVEPLRGKVVIDTNNYYPERDGQIAALDAEETTSSQLLQDRLPESLVVKGFNHIYAAQITTDGTPAGTPDRRALVIAGNDDAARATVTQLLDEIGFATVDLGPLTESWRIQPGTPGYGPQLSAPQLTEAVRAAVRPSR
jgi:predicted dinucleotide-binding enzyme